MHVERDGFVGLADVGGGLTNVAMVVPQRALAGLDGDRTGFMERWLAAKPQLEAAREREFGGKWIVERLVGASVAHPLLINQAARVLSRRRDMADLLIGVTGDFVPAREVLRASYLLRLFNPLSRASRLAAPRTPSHETQTSF
jgi:hypothetical protein